MDIPEEYGVVLSKDWSQKLHGYFSTNYYHLWLPYKHRSNRIHVNNEPNMKHIVTQLQWPNEPIIFVGNTLGNYFLETIFGDQSTYITCKTSKIKLDLLQLPRVTDNELYILVLNNDHCTNVDVNVNNFTEFEFNINTCTIFYDDSKMQDEANVRCTLIDQRE